MRNENSGLLGGSRSHMSIQYQFEVEVNDSTVEPVSFQPHKNLFGERPVLMLDYDVVVIIWE